MVAPERFRGKTLIKEYPNFAMYIDSNGIRECYKYEDLIDKLSREIWINKNKQVLIKRRKSHKKNKRLKQALEWEETNGDSDFFRFRNRNIDN